MVKKTYVDGYVIPIKRRNLAAYKKMAALGCKVWMEHGALDYCEAVGEDLKNDWGLSFIKMCKLKADETVILAFITYKSKTHRNRVNALAMKDPRLHMDLAKMPFTMDRFSVGGFKIVVSSSRK